MKGKKNSLADIIGDLICYLDRLAVKPEKKMNDFVDNINKRIEYNRRKK